MEENGKGRGEGRKRMGRKKEGKGREEGREKISKRGERGKVMGRRDEERKRVDGIMGKRIGEKEIERMEKGIREKREENV